MPRNGFFPPNHDVVVRIIRLAPWNEAVGYPKQSPVNSYNNNNINKTNNKDRNNNNNTNNNNNDDDDDNNNNKNNNNDKDNNYIIIAISDTRKLRSTNFGNLEGP